MASSVPLWFFCGLHGLADDAADGVGGGAFHPLRGVGVGAEGKARVILRQVGIHLIDHLCLAHTGRVADGNLLFASHNKQNFGSSRTKTFVSNISITSILRRVGVVNRLAIAISNGSNFLFTQRQAPFTAASI